jgi:hypothetical protein
MRYGNFSSSEIWKLCTLDRSGKGMGKPALTYIQEKIWERKLGRSIKNHVHSIETAWGTLLEEFAFNHMDLDYSLVSDEKRLIHPEIHSWTGIPDVKSLDLVGDIKCPFTLNSYCQMVEMDTREKLKEDKPEYYWQLVSNAILTERNKAGLFLFVPYQDELNEVREIAAKHDGDLPVSWIVNAPDKKMPYLIPGMTYKNIHEFIFDVPEEDKEFLTLRVKEADKLLNQNT